MAPSADLVDSVESSIARVLGPTEENWTKATATGTGLQVIGIALKISVQVKLISQAAREVLGQYAVLRSQIVETSKGRLAYRIAGRPYSPSIEAFPWPTLENNARTEGVLALPGDDSDGHELSFALAKVVRQELNNPLRNAVQKVTGPVDVFRIHVHTEPSLGRTLIILKFNSGALDRPSTAMVTQSFFTALNAVLAGQVPRLPDAPGILPSLEDLIKGKGSKNLIQKGIDTISYAMSANKFSLFPFSPQYSRDYAEAKKSTFTTETLNYTLGKEATVALLARCKREKTTYGAALSCAFLKGVANVKELKDKKLDKFSFTSLLDCRSFFEPTVSKSGLGNYTAGISQDEQVKSGADFWELARSISSSTERELGKLRQFSELPVLNMLFSQVLKRPHLTQKSALRTALFSLFVDGPLNAQWKNVDQLQLAGTIGPFASMHGIGPCFCLAEALIEGPELTLAVVYATPVYSRDQMEALAKTSFEALSAATKGT